MRQEFRSILLFSNERKEEEARTCPPRDCGSPEISGHRRHRASLTMLMDVLGKTKETRFPAMLREVGLGGQEQESPPQREEANPFAPRDSLDNSEYC